MVDTFLLLALARTGDQLQGIKKGVLELADVIAVNKADGPHEPEARAAARELAGALRLLRTGTGDAWHPPVVTCSGLTGAGLPELWTELTRHHETLSATGALRRRREHQQLRWVWAMTRDALLDGLRTSPAVRELAPRVERQVLDGTLTPVEAAEALLSAYRT
jgi:LAO/AO transport system kinase